MTPLLSIESGAASRMVAQPERKVGGMSLKQIKRMCRTNPAFRYSYMCAQRAAKHTAQVRAKLTENVNAAQ